MGNFKCKISCSCRAGRRRGDDSDDEAEPRTTDGPLQTKIRKLKLTAMCVGLLALVFHIALIMITMLCDVKNLMQSKPFDMWGSVTDFVGKMTSVDMVLSAFAVLSVAVTYMLGVSAWLYSVAQVAASFTPPVHWRFLEAFNIPRVYAVNAKMLLVAVLLDFVFAIIVCANEDRVAAPELLEGTISGALLFDAWQMVLFFQIASLEKKELAMSEELNKSPKKENRV